jgi:integrase/recombinase XerD
MTPEYNPVNERIKRQYFVYLKEATRVADVTVDQVAMALSRFESYTDYRDFKLFNVDAAVAFKKHLTEQTSQQTGRRLSSASLYSIFSHLKRFFHWLAGQPGYRSRISYEDSEYFNLTAKESRKANARRPQPHPTLDQVRHVITTMPTDTETDRRDRAIVAFVLLTGARDGAVVSIKLKHVDMSGGKLFQDAREVQTKFSKSFETFFFPVGDDIRAVVADWVDYLKKDLLWGNDDPLFPATQVGLNSAAQFAPVGLARRHWTNATQVRAIFKRGFVAAGLPYFSPHKLRNTLVQLGESLCQTPEQFKSWSQNLGHEGVMTTLRSYGAVGTSRQGEIIRGFAQRPSAPDALRDAELLAGLGRLMKSGKLDSLVGREGAHVLQDQPESLPGNPATSGT